MSIKKEIMTFFIGFIIFSLNFSFAFFPAQEKEKVPLKTKKQIIPQEVGKVFDLGIQTREPRLDIPIKFIQYLYLPARENRLHTIFLFKIKNSDLGFEEEKEEPSKSEEEVTPPQKLIANLNAFLRFYKLEKGNIVEISKEIYIPVKFEKSKEEFNPEEEHLCTTGYSLPPGDYLLALAFTSLDLTKIGTFYTEISLPDPQAFKNIDTTPIFFIKSIEQLPSPEMRLNVHQDFFRYSILKIEPKIELVFSQEQQPDIFYFIFGTSPHPETNKFEIEITYSVFKGEEAVIKFEPTTFPFPMISHPLPLKRADKSLEPGEYILEIKIVDKVSGSSITKKINFKLQ
ncbi:MAG: hypothetical protein ACE5WD_09495 [Candidatus Aminicenantia bacterium]